MYRLFFIFILFINLNASDIINFVELKFIEAIAVETKKKGSLEFVENKIKLKYKNSDRILIYENDTLHIKTDGQMEEVDLNKHISLRVAFLLIESIYKNELDILSEYFNINQEEQIISLKPKESLENYIKLVEFKRAKKIEYITIYLSNGNKTTIREIND